LDNESVDVVAADDSSGDGDSDNVDGDDEVIEDDGDDDEVVLPAPGVSEPSSDVASLKLQIKLAELTLAAQTSATQIRLAELEFEKMKLSANSSANLQSPALSMELSPRMNSL